MRWLRSEGMRANISLQSRTGIASEQRPKAELALQYNCPMCGQSVDSRSVYQVLYHLEGGHDPLDEEILGDSAPSDFN